LDFRNSILEADALLLPTLADLDTDPDPDLLFGLGFLPAIQNQTKFQNQSIEEPEFETHFTTYPSPLAPVWSPRKCREKQNKNKNKKLKSPII
jgi:hypothetical protein